MIDHETAAFRLTCLKENFRYRDSFEKHRAGLEAWHRGMEKAEAASDDAERRKGIKEAYAALHGKRPPVSAQEELDAEGKETYEALLDWYKRNPDPDASQFWGDIYDLPIERFTCPPFNVRWPDGKRVLNADEALAFLDPRKKIDSIEERRKSYVLSRIFAWTGVKDLPLYEKGDPDCARLRISLRLPEEEDLGEPRPRIQPHERVLLVNTQKKRSELVEEFEGFLDSIGKDTRKEPRIRAKKSQQLEVWIKRRAKIPFETIAEGLGIKIQRAKYDFYRMYELTQGFKFQPRKAEKDKPRRICATCRDKDTSRCDLETCPDLMYELAQVEKHHNPRSAYPGEVLRAGIGRDADDPDTFPEE